MKKWNENAVIRGAISRTETKTREVNDMDMKRKMKEKILDEIISLMDQEEGEELKKHSPKFMKVETNDPEVAEKLLKKSMVEDEESIPEEAEEESQEEVPDKQMSTEEEEDDEKRLRELYSKLK